MIILSNEILANKEQIDFLITNDNSSITENKKAQMEMGNMILDYIIKFSDASTNANLEYVDDILEIIHESQEIFQYYDKNIESLNKLIELNNKLSTDIQNNVELNTDYINKFNSEYMNANSIIIQNNLKIFSFLHKILEYSDFTSIDSRVKSEIENIQNEETVTSSNEEVKPLNGEENIVAENLGDEIVNSNSEEVSTSNNEKVEEQTKDEVIEENDIITENDLLENTLLISETKGRIILPYSIENVEQIYENNKEKYENVNDVVLKEYSLPFSSFKNYAFARFREAFRLMKNKEKKGIRAAFDLAMELIFNYNLHPAIITACKNIDELDIYLDYLETNETEKFDIFKIVFEIAPTVVKSKEKYV